MQLLLTTCLVKSFVVVRRGNHEIRNFSQRSPRTVQTLAVAHGLKVCFSPTALTTTTSALSDLHLRVRTEQGSVLRRYRKIVYGYTRTEQRTVNGKSRQAVGPVTLYAT